MVLIEVVGAYAYRQVSAIQAGGSPATAPSTADSATATRQHHVITTIGSGSLASAYAIMRAHEAGAAVQVPADGPITSAVGVPAAFSAYAEILAMASPHD